MELSPEAEDMGTTSKEWSFDFTSLPSEIRDLIWEATLPSARIFHVSGTTDVGRTAGPDELPEKFFKFYIKYSPPITTRICRESRAVALRHGGFFLSPHPLRPGPWFSPRRDILYFDRNQRHTLRPRRGKPAIFVRGWDRVLNVGLEWRAWFRDVPRPVPGLDMRLHWRSVIHALYLYMPNLKGIHYILPRVRHKGGVALGREPYGAARYPPDLLTLPEATGIPWEKARGLRVSNPGAGPFSATQGGAASASSIPAYLTTWKQIREDIKRSLESDDDGEDQEIELDWTIEEENVESEQVNASGWLPRDVRPEVIGWWLLRCGVPEEHGDPNAIAFLI